MKQCPIHTLAHFSKKRTREELGKPNLIHTNSISHINSISLVELARNYIPFFTGIHTRHAKNFYIQAHVDGSRKSRSFSLSPLGYDFYRYLVSHVKGVVINENIFLCTDTNLLGLIFFAIEPIDRILEGLKGQTINSDQIQEIKIVLSKLASIPDPSQKAVTDKLSILEYVQYNIDRLLRFKKPITATHYRATNVLFGIYQTKNYKEGKYGVCPALADGSLMEIVDILIPLYRDYGVCTKKHG